MIIKDTLNKTIWMKREGDEKIDDGYTSKQEEEEEVQGRIRVKRRRIKGGCLRRRCIRRRKTSLLSPVVFCLRLFGTNVDYTGPPDVT